MGRRRVLRALDPLLALDNRRLRRAIGTWELAGSPTRVRGGVIARPNRTQGGAGQSLRSDRTATARSVWQSPAPRDRVISNSRWRAAGFSWPGPGTPVCNKEGRSGHLVEEVLVADQVQIQGFVAGLVEQDGDGVRRDVLDDALAESRVDHGIVDGKRVG